MDHLRVSGERGKNVAKDDGFDPLDELLGKVDEAEPVLTPDKLKITPEEREKLRLERKQLEAEMRERELAWLQDPASVSDVEHEEYCLKFETYEDEKGYVTAFRCAVCEGNEKIRLLRGKMERSGIAPRYLDVRWQDLEQVEPVPALRKASSKGRLQKVFDGGECLLLWGKTGVGKTQLATLMVKSAIVHGWSANVVNLGSLGLKVRESYNRQEDELAMSEARALESLILPDFLVLDDLGAGETDNAAVENRLLYLASEYRQNNRRSTLITTNLTPTELSQVVGQRILNRFTPLTTIEINHGKNFRVGKKSSWLE